MLGFSETFIGTMGSRLTTTKSATEAEVFRQVDNIVLQLNSKPPGNTEYLSPFLLCGAKTSLSILVCFAGMPYVQRFDIIHWSGQEWVYSTKDLSDPHQYWNEGHVPESNRCLTWRSRDCQEGGCDRLLFQKRQHG